MTLETANKTTGTFSSTGYSKGIYPLPSIQHGDTLRVEVFGTTGKFTGTVNVVWGIDPYTTNGSTWQKTMNAAYTTTTSEIIEVGTGAFTHALQCSAISSGTIGYVLAK